MQIPFDPTHIPAATALWNAACGADLAISERAMRYNTLPTTGALQEGCVALADGRPVGFVLASALPASPDVSPPEMGWIDAIAVRPDAQRRGIGSALLAWAEGWLAEQGCTRARLGGSLRPFAPGLPSDLDSEPFFRRRGYDNRPQGETDWDVARTLADYTPRHNTQYPISNTRIRPAKPGDESALLAFFHREFPGRWRFEFEEFVAAGGRMADFMLLWREGEVDGFARLTLADSERPLDRFFMHRLPQPWGQLGPIGVGRGRRGLGLGGALLDAGLCHLADLGVNGCVIDWTSLVDFYGKYGFKPYRQYEMLMKALRIVERG
jgi:GNAT superfamily N-acetyltransferase